MISAPERSTTVGVALLAVLAICVVAAPVAGAGAVGGDATWSSDAKDMSTWYGFTADDSVVTYGVDGNPGFIVHYSEGGLTSLEEWANDSTDREIHSSDNATGYAVVSAPPEHMGVTRAQRWFGSGGLGGASYVEYVELNRRLSYSEPIERLETQEQAFNKPAWSGPKTAFGLYGSFEQGGVAYTDVNKSTMRESRGYHGAASTGYTGNGTTLGVVDTGLNYNEQLYQDRVIAGYNAITDSEANITLDPDGTANVSQSDYNNLSDGNLHGSFVTSQAAANTTGTNASYMGAAPDAHIIAVRSLNDDGAGSTADIAEGIEYACEGGADVVSLSLGTYVEQEVISQEISECYSDDDVSAVLVAVGNSRQTTRWVSYPASESSREAVIGVAAISGAPPSEAESAYFSNVGPHPQNGAQPTLAATGMKVQTQVDDGSGTLFTRTLSGTSMATPTAAGITAQLLEADSSLHGQPVEIRDRLQRTASPVPNAGETEVGAGSINASNAIQDREPEETQAGARQDPARARDGANGAVSGNSFAGLLG